MFEIGRRGIYERNIKEAIRVAKRGGFRVLEIHLSSPQFLPERYSVRERRSIQNYARKMDVALQVHGSLEMSLIFIDPDLRASAKRQMDRIVSFCAAIGARCLTLHPGQAVIYHTAEGEKLKNDTLYKRYYERLFEDSIKHLTSIARKDFYICIENTDNFTKSYRKILSRYLKNGKIFLTWDIRKNFSYSNDELLSDQWKFVTAHRQYVKNLHISGFGTAHGGIIGYKEKLLPFFRLFGGQDLPLIIEIMPEKQAVVSKVMLERLFEKFRSK